MPRFNAMGFAPRSKCPHSFSKDGLCQHGGGRGAITRNVGCLRSDLFHHLCAHVLEWILQLDFFRHRHAVFGDDRRAKLLLDDSITTLWAQRNLDCIGQNIDTVQNCLT
jgi:hypothetical protein